MSGSPLPEGKGGEVKKRRARKRVQFDSRPPRSVVFVSCLSKDDFYERDDTPKDADLKKMCKCHKRVCLYCNACHVYSCSIKEDPIQLINDGQGKTREIVVWSEPCVWKHAEHNAVRLHYQTIFDWVMDDLFV